MAASNARTSAEQDPMERELVLTRIFDAPRELVFDAWTDTKHIGSWYGPTGFTITTHEIDVRPGGVWRFIMHGPDGVDYPNKIVYLEIVRPERLVYNHGDDGEPGSFHVTVTFAEQGGKTRLTMRSLFNTAAEREYVVTHYHAIEGGNQTLDRLAQHLANGRRKLVVTRVFDAPRDLVWKAMTEPERLMQWWGPPNFTVLSCKVDLRSGGEFQYSMRAPNGHPMWGKWVYREIVQPERIVSVVSDTDEQGNPVPHPMGPNWPREILYTMTLVEQDGKTTMSVSGFPINATEEERKTFEDRREWMIQGFDGTLDKLTALLARSLGEAS
jgi:uncharacterized protein YndB with AHSA1/START domain